MTDINTLNIELLETKYTYTGDEICPEVFVKDAEDNLLVIDEDYMVEYSNNINIGTGTITIVGVNDYEGEKELTFTIEAISLENATITCGEADETGCYNTQKLEVKYNETVLEEDIDYTVETYTSRNKRIITTTFVLTGMNKFKDEVRVSYQTEIMSTIDISTTEAMKFVLDQSTFTFSGNENKPNIKVTDHNYELILGTDYEISYENNIDAGTGYVIVTGIGEDYSGNKTVEFSIETLSLESGSITSGSSDEDDCYDLMNLRVVVNDRELEKNVEYTYSITTERIDYAIYSTVTITGAKNYNGTISETFKTQRIIININDTDIDIEKYTFVYTGELIKPELITELVENEDYIVTFPNNSINYGSYDIIVEGIGNYNNMKIITFYIERRDISNATYECGEPDKDKCYDLNQFKLFIDEKELIRTSDYQFYASEREIEDGYIETDCTVIGINNYTGSINIKILTGRKQIYPGKKVNLELCKVYPRYGSIKSSTFKTGEYYLWDNIVVNNKIRITNNPNGIGKLGYITGWISVDDIIERTDIRVGDKVIVNGKINMYADGSGQYMTKNNIIMYIVDTLDPTMFEYCYAVASDINRNRQGWAKLDMLKRIED